MDRGRYRTVLNRSVGAGILTLLVVMAGRLGAQSPASTATPWVQASPAASPAKPLDGNPFSSPAVPHPREEMARAMARKREEELARNPPLLTPGKPLRVEPRISPDEREAYERNLALWRAMPLEERQALRGQAAERIHDETEKAYATSGLNLNGDQREMFALRYRQERRRLEREIQEKAAAERARRLPEVIDRLKREFQATPPAK